MIELSDSSGAADWAADWNEISEGLRKDLGAQIHTQWIRPIRPGSFEPASGQLLRLDGQRLLLWVEGPDLWLLRLPA